MPGSWSKIVRVLGSPKFFWVIIVFFAIESLWIAFSAVYPMVFDENTHFGIIQLYAHQWSPIFTHQPANADAAGALQHNPSFLYEWLLSFPYRILTHLTGSQTLQIICLRLINIALFGWSLWLLRKLFLKIHVSPVITHLGILGFIMVPVVPLLSAQLNYDNLVMPLATILLLLCVEFIHNIHGIRDIRKSHISLRVVICILLIGMIGCMVQYEVLPLFIGALTGIGIAVIYIPSPQRTFPHLLAEAFRASKSRQKALLFSALLLVAGLFGVTYGYNIAVLHNANPSCSQTLSRARCAVNETWARDEYNKAHRGHPDTNLVRFAGGWSYRLLVLMFYTSSGGAPQAPYQSINPLPVLFLSAIVVISFGLALAGYYWRHILWPRPELIFLLFVMFFYMLSLFVHNYAAFRSGGQKIGIQGRYAFPVLLILIITALLGYQRLLRNRSSWKPVILGVALLLCIQGGGALTYLVSSHDTWYWQNPWALHSNHVVRPIARFIVIDKTPLTSINL